MIEPSRSAKWRSSISAARYVFAAVFLLRLLVLSRFAASPSLLPSSGDMSFYNEWAQRIAHGKLTDGQAFYSLPLYAYWLAALYNLFGYTPFVPALLQCCADAGTAVLIFKISTRVFAESALKLNVQTELRVAKFTLQHRAELIGVLAAAGWALFVPAQSYAVILMPTALGVFVFWYFIWQIVNRERAPTPLTFLCWGALIGITAMAIATTLFAAALLSAAIVLKWQNQYIRAQLASAALLLSGVFCGTAPCWMHNYFVAHDRVFLSAHSGVNFWIGNNPDADGYPKFPGLRAAQAAMLDDSIQVAEAEKGRPLKRSQVSAYWSAKARSFIAQHPAKWLKLIGRKFANFWNAFQYDDLGVIGGFGEQRIVFPGVRFGIVAALAIPGFFVTASTSARSRWIAAAVLLQLFALLPVFVTERYRLPAAPGLLLFAAAGVWHVWEACLAQHGALLARYTCALAVAAIAISWPQKDPALWALEPYNTGRQALEVNDLARAEKKLMLARTYVSANPEIDLALGNLRLAQNNRVAAERYYEQALRVDPEHKAALNNLGILALDANRGDVAEHYLRAALKREPHNPKTHFLLAKARLSVGDGEAAKIEIDQALALDPERSEFLALRDEIGRRFPN